MSEAFERRTGFRWGVNASPGIGRGAHLTLAQDILEMLLLARYCFRSTLVHAMHVFSAGCRAVLRLPTPYDLCMLGVL